MLTRYHGCGLRSNVTKIRHIYDDTIFTYFIVQLYNTIFVRCSIGKYLLRLLTHDAGLDNPLM